MSLTIAAEVDASQLLIVVPVKLIDFVISNAPIFQVCCKTKWYQEVRCFAGEARVNTGSAGITELPMHSKSVSKTKQSVTVWVTRVE